MPQPEGHKRLCNPADAGGISDFVIPPMQGQSQVGILGQRVGANASHRLDRRGAISTDRSRHDRDAVPFVISTAIKVEAADVFKRLASGNPTPQVADPRMTRDSADRRLFKGRNEKTECVWLEVCVGV